MKKIITVSIFLCFIITMLTGCNSTNDKAVSSLSEIAISGNDSNMFTQKDTDISYNQNSAIKITLNGLSATATDKSVKISSNNITLTKAATYIVSGSLNDGTLAIDTSNKSEIHLVLDGATIKSSKSAPLYIKKASKVFVTLKGNNTLSSGNSFTAKDGNNIDGTVFSKQDLTFNGDGKLSISSPAGHGIVCKDNLCFTSGSYTITSASHAIQANDSVKIKNSTITADSGKDGIHAENSEDISKGFVYISGGTIKLESEGDGISSSSYTQITNGTIEILAGGGYENSAKEHSDNFGNFGGGGGMFGGPERPGGPNRRNAEGMSYSTVNTANTTTESDDSTSMKGIKSGNSMKITGGSITINSADDAIHSNISTIISGGTFNIASGDDAIHAENTLTVSKGTIKITESYEGLEALHIKINGGDINLKANDDGLNAAGGTDNSGTGGRDERFEGKGGPGASSNSNGSIIISGGKLYINASGDGIDANGTLSITGGHTTVVGPTQGDTATLDYDKTGTISGGTFIGTGASNMAQSISSSNQGVIALSVGSQAAKTKIIIKDKSNKEIISYSPELPFQVVIISTPKIKSGETYTVTVGTESGEFTAD